jgi:hypothetical protein
MQSEPRSESGAALLAGTHSEYFWIASGSNDYSGTLVGLCPEIFIGRYMVVTAVDSGTPRLAERQKIAGWVEQNGIVYSPALITVDDIFFQRDGQDAPGFDEWYLFPKPTDLGAPQDGNPFEEATAPSPGRPMVFVGTPCAAVYNSDPVCEPLRRMFWAQMDWIQPESYIADGSDRLTFMTRNRELFELVLDKLDHSA